jgi:hypothetical protein
MEMYLKSIKENGKSAPCNQLDLETLGYLTEYAQKSSPYIGTTISKQI